MNNQHPWLSQVRAQQRITERRQRATHARPGYSRLLPVLRDGRPAGNALLVLTVSTATHGLIDRRWPVRARLRATASPGFATVE